MSERWLKGKYAKVGFLRTNGITYTLREKLKMSSKKVFKSRYDMIYKQKN